jgi:hypothetical protein
MQSRNPASTDWVPAHGVLHLRCRGLLVGSPTLRNQMEMSLEDFAERVASEIGAG